MPDNEELLMELEDQICEIAEGFQKQHDLPFADVIDTVEQALTRLRMAKEEGAEDDE